MSTPDQNPMPNIVAVDPLAYLAERVKRGTDFVRAVGRAGTVTELCLSEHLTTSDDIVRAEASDY